MPGPKSSVMPFNNETIFKLEDRASIGTNSDSNPNSTYGGVRETDYDQARQTHNHTRQSNQETPGEAEQMPGVGTEAGWTPPRICGEEHPCQAAAGCQY